MIVDIDLGSLTMLVVEGGNYDRLLIRSVLASFGAGAVAEAGDRAAAIAVLAQRPIDLLVVDRDSGGVALVRQIRGGDAGCRVDLPVVMVSGASGGEVVADARNAGVDEFLAKPVTAESLYRRVRAALLTPRPFVQSEVYVGPCRRSVERQLATGDRRVNPPLPRPEPRLGAEPAEPAGQGQSRTSHRRFSAGTVIFREGDPADEAFVVEAGCVVISRHLGGRSVVLGSLGPGGIFGELALVDEDRRTATATTAEETTCMVLPRRALGTQIARSPDLVVLVLETLLRNIGKMGRELVEAHARLHRHQQPD